MIDSRTFVGWGIEINEAKKEAFERLNHFVITGGYRIIDIEARHGAGKRREYWYEIVLFYEYNDPYEEE